MNNSITVIRKQMELQNLHSKDTPGHTSLGATISSFLSYTSMICSLNSILCIVSRLKNLRVAAMSIKYVFQSARHRPGLDVAS